MVLFTHQYYLFFFLILVTIFGPSHLSSANLSVDFYEKSCPEFPSIVHGQMTKIVALSPRMGASVLRLFFHDCFVNGCDGSVLLADTKEFKGEQTAPPNNNSLRGFDVIDRMKIMIESSCEGIVSCADLLAVAARDAITLLGGPYYEVAVGRRDTRSTSLAAVSGQLPGPSFNLSQLISAFGSKGFTAEEMVALSGSHTIGQARCSTFRARISNDTNIDKEFARALRSVCTTNDDNLAALNMASPDKFDNGYFLDLMAHRGLLHSDQELYNGGPLDELVLLYAMNETLFEIDFISAMIKMGNLSPPTGEEGEVRRHCFKTN